MSGTELALAILVLIALVGVHRRYMKLEVIKALQDKGATTREITEVLRAYNEEKDNG